MRNPVVQCRYPLRDRFQLDAPRRHLDRLYRRIGFGNWLHT